MALGARSVREIPIQNLTVSSYQVRRREVDKDLNELIENIRVHGLLEPILVTPSDAPNEYEIVAGQRRWLAMKELGYEYISAAVLEDVVDEGTARAISISENLIRHDVGSKDLIDACTNLYRKYGSIKAVADDLGLPHNKVRNFVKFDRLRPELKKRVEMGELDIKTAVKVEDYFTEAGVENGQLNQVLRDIKDMTNAQKADYFRSARQSSAPRPANENSGHGNGYANGDTRRPGDVHQILVTLLRDDYKRLRQWADARSLTQDQAAARIISAFFRGYQQSSKAS